MKVSIQSVDLDVAREPLVRPFGFKGGFFREKWLDSRGGVFRLDESFYESGGGVLDPL